MVVGLGVDLIEIPRVDRALARWGDRLVAKLLAEDESRRLPSAGRARAEQLAFAIAGKEAASKAIGTGWTRGVRWRDVVVDTGPPPRVELRGRAAEVARGLGSSGRTVVRLETRGDLVFGEVRLLA